MIRKALVAVAMGLALGGAVVAQAQSVPQTFTFTARVSNAEGPLNGTHQMILRMYDQATAGTKLWEESHIDVQVTDGLVTLVMGSETAITQADLADNGIWVEVVVDGSTLSPRTQLRGVPYARRSQDSIRLGGQLPSAFVEAAGDTMSGSLGINGDLNLSGKLALRGNDAYLRLNEGGGFANGVYTPSVLRADGGYRIGGGAALTEYGGWLRLNQDVVWGNGVHTPGVLNVHAGISTGTWYDAPGVGNVNVQGKIQTYTHWWNLGDCPGGWNCDGGFWDVSIASLYYSGLAQRSDRRLKKDIQPIETGLARLLKLRPVTYRWKEPRITGIHYGFIAQEVEEVIPDLVTQNNKGYKALETQGILPVTVKAVQELKAENDKLRADVDQLRQEIEAIKRGTPLPAKGSTGKTASRWLGPVSLGGGVLVFAFGLLATIRRRRSDPPV